MSLLAVLIPRFAWLELAPELTVIPVLLVMETVDPLPVSRMPQLLGPAVPSPKVSANAEELQNKTSNRAVIPNSFVRHALQDAGLLYEHLLPDQ